MIEKPEQSNLNTALNFLKRGEFENAYAELERGLKNDLDDADIEYALKGIRFWDDKIKSVKRISGPLENGEYMISNWKPFLRFMEKQGEKREAIIYALKCAVFTSALTYYAELLGEGAVLQDAEPYRKVGLCYKALGDYDRALEFLRYAAELAKDSSAVLAELADCYALYGEIKFSKVFFKEAFFIDPSSVELQFLESEIIKRLIRKVEELGYPPELVLEWIPVYGVLDGVFNVKRELHSLEFAQLKQKIFLLENDEREKKGSEHAKIVPRLINGYFWLIDHYVNVNENKAKIDKILLKIKVLDKDIYKRYIG